MYNVITLIGNLGADPDIKTRDNGDKYAVFNLATHKKVRGEKMTDWHKIVVWDSVLAERIEQYVSKGSKILVQGRLTYNEWEKEGNKTKTAEIHLDRFEAKMEMMDSKSDNAPAPSSKPSVSSPSDDDVNIPF